MSVLTSRLLQALGWLEHGFGTRQGPLLQEGMASLKQIHSAICRIADHGGCLGEGDALLSRTPGLLVSVRTADCFPVLLADAAHRAVAAVHAGWRGSAAGIAIATLREMRKFFGTDPQDVVAAIGPGIGACCYEVGEEVARRFGMETAGHLDLAAHNLRQLAEAGVPHSQIETLGGCTFCGAERFHSWRREGPRAGRMISYVGIRAPG
ncbi:MAG TPA: peptidoglycan editing factor PgeF [Bryobacteraceae bacterium]|nr:peptidoglycan editing factor PgeF [Bryobacteraceae bacterium]